MFLLSTVFEAGTKPTRQTLQTTAKIPRSSLPTKLLSTQLFDPLLFSIMRTNNEPVDTLTPSATVTTHTVPVSSKAAAQSSWFAAIANSRTARRQQQQLGCRKRKMIGKGNFRRVSSIAPIGRISVLLLATTHCFAQQAAGSHLSLPELANTPELDRLMLREISDEHIYEGPLDSQILQANQTSGPQADHQQPLNEITADNQKNVADSVLPAKSGASNAKLAPIDEVTTAKESAPESFGDVNQTKSMWERIRASNRLPLAENERVLFYEQQYEREAHWIGKILERGELYLPHLVEALDRRYLPLELALLPAIESGFLPEAMSSGNAAGLWQIVPITAKEIGIQRDQWFDGRADIIASTTAAIDYISYLNAEFNGDWELTLAAYNAGPGRVRAAVKKNADAGLATDYWSLELPLETLNYLPKLIALINFVKAPTAELELPEITDTQPFELIDPGFRVSLDRVAKITGIDEVILGKLNAGLTHGITPPDGPHFLLIPAGSGELFMEAFANVDKRSAFSEPLTHEVVAGDTVSGIAHKYGISQQRLLVMNGLDNARIKIGQKLAVIDARNIGTSRIEYTVAIGDTLSEIAVRFSVSIADITNEQGTPLTNDIIHPGETLRIRLQAQKAG